MWSKPLAALLLSCIARGGTAAANLFNENDEQVGVAAEAPKTHRSRAHNLFDAPGEEEESERYTCKSIVAIAYSSRQPVERRGEAVERGLKRLRKRKHSTDKSSDDDNKEDVDHHPEEGFVCELEGGSVAPIEATFEQLEEMRTALSNGTLISAVSTMEVDMFDVVEEDDELGGDDVGVSGSDTPSKSHSKSAKVPPGPIHLSSNSRRLVEHPQRRLNRLKGVKKLLVIRMTDSEGREPPGDADYYSDKFFGTSGDDSTPKAQIYGCSNGAMDLSPDFGSELNSKMTADGVLDVTIKSSLKKISTEDAWPLAQKEAEAILGCKLPDGCDADHVAFLMEDCYKGGCGWVAYAYIDWWPSVFVENYGAHPAVVTHELGVSHTVKIFCLLPSVKPSNLTIFYSIEPITLAQPEVSHIVKRIFCPLHAVKPSNSQTSIIIIKPIISMAHSGWIGAPGLDQYGDHSCSMGNPYFTDYHDKICFNPAKNFQIANSGAWYDAKYVITLNMNSDTPYREFRFVGVAEYDEVAQYDSETNEDIAVVVKLETGSAVDFFVGFNRKTGQNSHNKLASDEVTIIQAGANGESYAQSWFTAGLAQGESHSFDKWAKTNEELVVKVVKIDTSEAPGYADVIIALGGATKSPTSAPTPAPGTSSPSTSSSPSHAPIISPSMVPSVSPSLMPSHAPIISPSTVPSVSPTLMPSTFPSGSPSRTPGISPTKKFSTKDKNANQKAKGIMYQMQAEEGDVKIEKISFKTKDDKDTEVQLYFQLGAYESFPGGGMDSNDWEEPVFDDIPARTSDGLREVVLDEVLTIPKGETASIQIVGKKEILYEEGDEEFSVAADTGDFKMITGCSTKKPFEQRLKDADFVGEITYHTYTAKVTSTPSLSPSSSKLPTLPPNDDSTSPSMLPSNRPSSSPSEDDGNGGDDTPKEYDTPNVNDAGDNAKGIMFTITSKSKEVRITDLGIIGKDAKESDLWVYYQTGYYSAFDALNKNAWDEALKKKVALVPGEIFDLKLDKDITIPAGETVSVYVVSKKGVLYEKPSKNEFEIYAQNDDFDVRVGTTTKKEFQQPEKLAEFAGRFVYQTTG
eukprot:scaffold1483_cov84-Skeletonema_dohrnii-CCMP3373.AAC.1